MGGKKKKIKIEKIKNEASRTVAFSKRRKGLFCKASQLCVLFPDTQIAILTTPFASNSHASFYSFGHSSVDNVVSSFLSNQPPLLTNQENNGSELGFWWEDKSFDVSENVDELKEAVDSLSVMLNNARIRLDDILKNKQRDESLVNDHHHHQEVEEVLQIYNEETTNTNQIPELDGVTFGSASNLLMNEEEWDDLKLDDIIPDLDIDSMI